MTEIHKIINHIAIPIITPNIFKSSLMKAGEL